MSKSPSCPRCSAESSVEHKYCPGCGFPLFKLREQQRDPFIGTVLPGGHNILELIEVGGMGRVYRAEQTMLGRTVAVKVIHPHLLGNPNAEARFVTEARAASKLNHPNSVSVIDFGKIDGRFYLVMEFLRGRDLAHVLHHEWPLSAERIADILSQTLAALGEAHHLGIVHRDLKPENIILEAMLSGGHFVKVLDFGLVKLRGNNERTITGPNVICGTLEYMAPEQVRGETVDGRADIYSCGVLLYQMLTGQLPFEADDDKTLAMLQTSQLPADPRVLMPSRSIPSALADTAMRALVKDPAGRFQCAQDMADALRVYATPSAARRGAVEFRDCEQCAAPVPKKQRYCGDCGAIMRRRHTAPSSQEEPRSRNWRASSYDLPLLEREEPMAWFLGMREEVGNDLVAAHVYGEPGCGKTRLLHALLRESERLGDAIVSIQPDPWRAGVVYYGLRAAISQLLDCNEQGPPPPLPHAPAEVRGGLKVVFQAASATAFGIEQDEYDALLRNQRLLAAEALRWALEQSATGSGQLILLAIDDWDLLDGASRNVFSDVLCEDGWRQGWVVVTSRRADDLTIPCESYELEGLSTAMAACLIQNKGQCPSGRQLEAARQRSTQAQVAPLYVEQLLHFETEGGGEPPAKLPDLIAKRIDRLQQHTRQVLQAIAVVGNHAHTSQLIALLPDASILSQSLKTLKKAGMVDCVGHHHGLGHDLIREVVLGTMPRAVRKALHGKARHDFGLAAGALPLAARAQHAFYGSSGLDALALLEQLADQCIAHEDRRGAIQACRIAVERARRELSQGELPEPAKTIGRFACKLATELAREGELDEARGVLQEAIHACAPSEILRCRLVLQLADITAEREHGLRVLAWLEESLRYLPEQEHHYLRRALEDAGQRLNSFV